MMQNTIEMLYNGEVYPAERMVPNDKAYREKCRDNGELKEAFVDGFKLGARLMLEILGVGDDE